MQKHLSSCKDELYDYLEILELAAQGKELD